MTCPLVVAQAYSNIQAYSTKCVLGEPAKRCNRLCFHLLNTSTDKVHTSSTFGLLQPLPIPVAIWEDIPLDFIVLLPSYDGHTVISVVVVRFSKAAHFGTLPPKFSAFKAMELFTNMICHLHGYPKTPFS